MAEEVGKAFGIEKFDGTDFAYWRMQIELSLWEEIASAAFRDKT